jgi:hypothetical protein
VRADPVGRGRQPVGQQPDVEAQVAAARVELLLLSREQVQ